jgi:hypothetical protein
MIVPTFWAEGRIQHKAARRQVTVRRFGWSDESQADAQANADARAREALDRILSGEKLPRRDPKRAYNGAVGVPIREEIVGRHAEIVLTRNSYGALCLNTPNVLFADIDLADEPSTGLVTLVFAILLAAAVTAGLVTRLWLLAVVGAVVALFVSYAIGLRLKRWLDRRSGGALQRAKSRITSFLSNHPEWHLRLYETPNGLRLLAMHAVFDPADPIVPEFFRAVGADPIYTQMCLRQHCFRARVSPKPWRIGIEQHLRPRPGVWPIQHDRLPERRRWIADYERAAASFASCRYLESLGSPTIHPTAADVQRIHDDLCQAHFRLPLA